MKSKVADALSEQPQNPALGEMVWIFLKLGTIGFGGGIAMIALMEVEFVKRRHCLEHSELLHGVALGQILGSFPVNAALFIGYRLHGLIGGLLAVIAFMLPSLVLVVLLGWLYFTYAQIPSLQGVLAGLGPVVIALILSAAWSMGSKAIGGRVAIAIVVGAGLASFAKVNPLITLGVGGLLGWLLKLTPKGAVPQPRPSDAPAILAVPFASQILPQQLATVGQRLNFEAVSQWAIASTFFKVGLVFFGGGFVLIPVLNQLMVTELGWLTKQEFIDGVAISQLTPGPIAVIATFAGYRVAGLLGAAIATAGLFLPSIVLMVILSHFYQKMRHLQGVKHTLAGVNPAVVGMILAAAVVLGESVFPLNQPEVLIVNSLLMLLGLLLMMKLKWHPAIALGIGAGVGVLRSLILS